MNKERESLLIMKKEIELLKERFPHKFEDFKSYLEFVEKMNKLTEYFRRDIFKFLLSNQYI